MTSREDNVLKPRDPSLTDENDWEEFSLSEVRILLPGKSRYANLLAASPDNPVQVTGCLDEVEEEQESLVIDEDYLTKRIVLENVTHYAYGQHSDGEVGFWVAGRAGWFSISPARGYRPMFNDVVEAIDLLYFLADKHQPKRRKRRTLNPTVEDLCEEYIIHTHGICEDADDSVEVFYKHRQFLLSRMLKREEDIPWTQTNIFEHLCEKFPEDYEQLKAEYEQKEGDADTDAEEHSTPEQPRETRPSSPDPTAASRDQANTIYQVVLDLKEAGYLARRQLTLELLTSTLVDRYEVEDVEYARELLASRADVVLELMDEAKTSTFDWSRKVIYRELKALAKENASTNITFTPLQPRTLNEDGSSGEDSENEDSDQLQRPRVRKSVLRPKGSIAIKKSGKRARSIGVDPEYLSDDNADAMDEFETPSKVRGHDLVRDPLSTRAKRTRSFLSDSGSTPILKTPLQETLQSRNTSVSVADQEPSDLDSTHGLDDLPSDTWACQVPGCGKMVSKASLKRSQKVIDDHSLGHADDTKAKLDLVFAEQQLNIGLPVDNLLSRIREMGTADAMAFLENGASEV